MSRKRLQLTDHPIGCRKQNPGLVQSMGQRPLGGFRRSVIPRSARSLTCASLPRTNSASDQG